ncbi:MAG: hypothetical protein AAFY08_09760 [Planctomycetota bacterium]
MSDKRTINLAIPADLADEFDRVSAIFGHGKQKGLILAAAIRLFLDTPPERQGELIQAVFADEVSRGVRAMRLGQSPPARKAAKKRGQSKKPFTR